MHDKADAPRLGVHDKGILSRQTSYGGKKEKEKKKNGLPGIGASYMGIGLGVK